MQTWKFTCTVKVKCDFVFRPEILGIYNMEAIEQASVDYLTNIVDDFDGFSVNDKYELVEISDNKDRALITFEAEFKTTVESDVWRDGSDVVEETLQDIFEEGELVSFTSEHDERTD